MKSTILCLCLFLSFAVFSKDMSRTETYNDSNKEFPDGSSVYVGGCSTHQDYEGKMFTIGETLVEAFETMNTGKEEISHRLKNIEKELLLTAGDNDSEYFYNVDDLTVERIYSTKFDNLDLYRLNVGVGGGNGYYEVYNRTLVHGKPKYKKLSHVMDGDVEFCDSMIWIKRP